MMKLFVTYDMALKLKQLGFDEHCVSYYAKHHKFELKYFDRPHAFWTKNSEATMFTNFFKPKDKVYNCTAPTLQQVVDWFREKHNIHIIHIVCGSQKEVLGYKWFVQVGMGNQCYETKMIKDYYNGMTEAINEAIKLITKK